MKQLDLSKSNLNQLLTNRKTMKAIINLRLIVFILNIAMGFHATATTYTISFDKTNGTGGSDNVSATYGSAMPSATAPTKTGYTFVGYYTAQNATGTKYYNADMTSATNWDIESNTTLYAGWMQNGSIIHNGFQYNEVTSSVTGRVWLDRNLGAFQSATASDDEAAYGDLYQWGRLSDGHEKRTSATTDTKSANDNPGHGNFITTADGEDWRYPKNDDLWQGVNGTNNPAPEGYRLPTLEELAAEVGDDVSDALSSELKLPLSGIRYFDNASIKQTGTSGYGFYWTSTRNTSGVGARYVYFGSSTAGNADNNRSFGCAVRLIKELTYTVSYNGNGNTNGTVPTDDNEYYDNNEVTVLGNTGNLKKTDHIFIGWNTQADGKGTDYADNTTFSITQDTTMYAKWLHNDSTGITITLTESGSDVIAEFSGRLNMEAFNAESATGGGSSYIYPAGTSITFRGNLPAASIYDCDSYTIPENLGSGSYTWTTGKTGDNLGVNNNGKICLNKGLNTGEYTSGSMKAENTTISEMGIKSGTHIWTYTTGEVTQTVTLKVPMPNPIIVAGTYDISEYPATTDLVVGDGSNALSDVILTGTNNTMQLQVENKVSVTFNNLEIDQSGNAQKCAVAIRDTATIIVADGSTNTIKSGNLKAAINAPAGTTLTINGTGTLVVTGGYFGAGIGGNASDGSDDGETSGTITIESGTITAKGGQGAAGIGGGMGNTNGGSGGITTITGGTITATCDFGGAGIGGGFGGAANGGSGGIIHITGTANVTATGQYSSGIGGGLAQDGILHYGGSSGNITIDGNAVVVATDALLGTGIGGGTSASAAWEGGKLDTVIIGGNAKVTATGTGKGAGIGGGIHEGSLLPGKAGTIIIKDNATVTATGAGGAAGIGGAMGGFGGTGGTISIANTAKVYAQGSDGAMDIGDAANVYYDYSSVRDYGFDEPDRAPATLSISNTAQVFLKEGIKPATNNITTMHSFFSDVNIAANNTVTVLGKTYDVSSQWTETTGAYLRFTYRLTFLDGYNTSGSDTLFTQMVDYDADISALYPNDPNQVGYTFTDWDKDTTNMPGRNLTISAQWKINTYRLTFLDGYNTGDSDTLFTQMVDYDADISALYPNHPKRMGYTFTDWNKDTTNMPSRNLTISAQWQINTYRLTFLDGHKISGSDTLFTQMVDYDADISALYPNHPKRTGHTFTDWDKDTTNMPSRNLTISAQWQINTYRLTFLDGYNTSGSDTLFTQMVDYDADISALYPNHPKRTGYTFTDWDKDTTNMPSRNLTISAQWQINTYRLTFLDGYNTSDSDTLFTQMVDYDADISALYPNHPKRTGHTFTDWDKDTTNMPSRNLTISAQWDKNIVIPKDKQPNKTDGTIVDSNGNEIYAETDENGNLIFSLLPVGNYYWVVDNDTVAVLARNNKLFIYAKDTTISLDQANILTDDLAKEINKVIDEMLGNVNEEQYYTETVVNQDHLNAIKNADKAGVHRITYSVIMYKRSTLQSGNSDEEVSRISITVKVNIENDKPVVVITFLNDVFGVDNYNGEWVRYEWYHNGTIVGTKQYYYNSVGYTGIYYVICYTAAGVAYRSDDINIEGMLFMNVYPSPASKNSIINVDIKNMIQESNYTLHLYDINGNIVQTVHNIQPSNSIVIDSNIAGICLMILKENGKIVTKRKIIVQ